MLSNGSELLALDKTCRLTALSVDSMVDCMTDPKRRRSELGGARSAALPFIWAEMWRRGWSDAQLAAAMNESRAVVSRLLYGDRPANRHQATRLLELFGVPLSSWDEPCPVRVRKHRRVSAAQRVEAA